MILAVVAARESAETFTWLMDLVAQGFEALGAAILVAGVIWSVVLAVMTARRTRSSAKAYLVARQAFGGTLLLGLEVLVAADLVRTVAISPTLDNVLVLALIVVIRTFLSFSLETEIEGVAPWRRTLTSGAETIHRATERTRDSGTSPSSTSADGPVRAPGEPVGSDGAPPDPAVVRWVGQQPTSRPPRGDPR